MKVRIKGIENPVRAAYLYIKTKIKPSSIIDKRSFDRVAKICKIKKQIKSRIIKDLDDLDFLCNIGEFCIVWHKGKIHAYKRIPKYLKGQKCSWFIKDY